MKQKVVRINSKVNTTPTYIRVLVNTARYPLSSRHLIFSIVAPSSSQFCSYTTHRIPLQGHPLSILNMSIIKNVAIAGVSEHG